MSLPIPNPHTHHKPKTKPTNHNNHYPPIQPPPASHFAGLQVHTQIITPGPCLPNVTLRPRTTPQVPNVSAHSPVLLKSYVLSHAPMFAYVLVVTRLTFFLMAVARCCCSWFHVKAVALAVRVADPTRLSSGILCSNTPSSAETDAAVQTGNWVLSLPGKRVVSARMPSRHQGSSCFTYLT